MQGRVSRISNAAVSVAAGVASFLFTLVSLLVLQELDDRVAAATLMGLFALLIVWVAAERPNTAHSRAVAALIDRLLAVKSGDLDSPAPTAVHQELPALAAAVENLFEQVRSNLENVNAMALYDPVTALPNRVHFKREAERMLKARRTDEQLALLFIDLDRFKDVNDSLGHARGDEVLKMVADRLRRVVKSATEAGTPQPLLARLAGDEFTLLFPGLADAQEGEQLAQEALAALTQIYESAGREVSMGASIGVAIAPAHGEELAALMKAADIAMYHAKASGRAQVCVYQPQLASVFEHKLRAERDLREGLARGELELIYQPQICARTGAVVAGEALIHWNHAVEGMQLPDSFIAAAEESGLGAELGDWLIEAVAAHLSRWQAAGLGQSLSLGISAHQLGRTGFLQQLQSRVGNIAGLELELSERYAMRASGTLLSQLAALRQSGGSVAISDFGAGFSNLSRLKDLPLDRVKLHRDLVHDVDLSESSRTVVAAAVHLIHGLGLKAIAEGLERPAQLDVLRAIGCDVFQGRTLAAPMREPDFVAWIGETEPLTKIA